MVEDVSWVQDQIIAKLRQSLKRGQDDVEEVPKAKRFVVIVSLLIVANIYICRARHSAD
jgi:hypothetical protein